MAGRGGVRPTDASLVREDDPGIAWRGSSNRGRVRSGAAGMNPILRVSPRPPRMFGICAPWPARSRCAVVARRGVLPMGADRVGVFYVYKWARRSGGRRGRARAAF